MPRYSEPSAYPRPIEVLGEHRLDMVAVMQRRAGVGDDDFADVEALEDFNVAVGHQPNPNVARLHGVPFDHLDRQMVNGGAGNGDAATALGIDVDAGEQADLERRVAGQRYPDMAELGGAVDDRRNQPDPSDQVRRIVAADAHGRARIEFEDLEARDFGIEFDFVADGDPEHRPG